LQDREHSAIVRIRRWKIEFHEDVADVFFDGARADHEHLGNGLIAASFGHQGEDLAFSRCQSFERILSAASRN
jgi:hypothetical protein